MTTGPAITISANIVSWAMSSKLMLLTKLVIKSIVPPEESQYLSERLSYAKNQLLIIQAIAQFFNNCYKTQYSRRGVLEEALGTEP
ncbi:MAG: hypothetical protein KA714_10365 [Limnoraphis sp. WC205]|jgi:hypothetical protein|nr:hypothetical protein [Limnoraphis sp. WC205]